MKKYKIFLFIFLIIVIMVLSVFLYFNISSGNNENSKEKALAEIEYVETKLVNLFNELNNIESRNYTVSAKEIESPSKEENSESSSTNTKESTEKQSEGQKQEQSKSEEEQSSSNNDQGEQEEKTLEEYEMKETGILTKTEDIDWEHIKTEVENLYSSIPTITLDLYKAEIPKENILSFNQEFDKLTISVKEGNKENTLMELSNVYNYIPIFTDNVTDSELYKVVIKTKNNLFKAYSELDSKKWNDISNNVKTTIDTYSSLLSNANIEKEKQESVNKVYIMLNELQNAVNVQDESVFLIKYKNILEEMNNLE